MLSIAIAGVLVLMMASGAGAQMQPMTPPQSSPGLHPATPGGMGSPSPQSPMMGHGPMTGMMMCPMMGQSIMGQSMMGAGMDPRMMGGMMAPSDPKSMARMLRLRGDMMKAMGEVLLKHAQVIEQEK